MAVSEQDGKGKRELLHSFPIRTRIKNKASTQHVHRLPQRHPEPARPGQALGEKPRPRAWWPANLLARHGLPVFGVIGFKRRVDVLGEEARKERGRVSMRPYLLQESQSCGLAQARGRAGDEGRDVIERHVLRLLYMVRAVWSGLCCGGREGERAE